MSKHFTHTVIFFQPQKNFSTKFKASLDHGTEVDFFFPLGKYILFLRRKAGGREILVKIVPNLLEHEIFEGNNNKHLDKMCIHHSQHMALVYVKNLPFWTPNIFRSLRYTHLWFWGVEFNTHVSDIFTIIKAHCHLDGFWCSSTPLRLLKSFCNPPLILTPLQGCALCSLAFPLTLFFKGVWHLWKCVLMVEGESSGSRGRWSPFSPVVRDAKGLFVSCPVVRGVLKGKPQMTTSFGWTKVGALSCNCSHSN